VNRQRLYLALILAGYLIITLAYGVVNPLFEAPDEHWHYFTADYIAGAGRLPVVETPPDEFLGQEAAQPPLYYLLGAALIAPIDTAGGRDAVWLNPFAWIGNADALNNVNRMIHTPEEAWPWQGYALAAHLLRILSTFLGLGTLLAIFGSGRLLWPGSSTRPLMATALVAFLPQFNFIHASITNDSLITFLCSLGLYQLIWFWRNLSPQTVLERRHRWRLILLGLTIGLAALSKNAGVLLLIYSVGFLIIVAVRDGLDRKFRPVLALAGPPVVVAVLVAGWLWLRNQRLYGDWTATNQFIEIAGGDRGYTLWQVLAESDGLLLSLIGVFGWLNLKPPDWVYLVWGAILILAFIGVLSCAIIALRGASRSAGGSFIRSEWFLALMLAGWVGLVYAGLATFMLRTEAAQGRLLFPAILPLSLGVAWGLAGWGRCTPKSLGAFNRRLSPLVGLAVLATSVYSLIYVISPAYEAPEVVNRIPDTARPVLRELIDRGPGISLLAAEVETETAQPGDIVWMTLYWQTGHHPPEPPEFVMEMFGRDANRIANLHSYHGRGLYPATLWPPGAVIADRFAVRIAPDAVAPVLGRVFARVEPGEPGIEVATVKIVPDRFRSTPDVLQAELGDNIALANVRIVPEQVQPGRRVRLSVRWYVPLGRPDQDYTTLVHLGQPDLTPLATGDSPPLRGDYPTRVWSNGETIDDSYTLIVPDDLMPGRYPVWIGMYNPATGERLPLKVGGIRQANDVYLAGWVEVVR
jgi:4-amino-4-deoxy-L-arabinose transferase-like glycosyltransferase